MILKEINNTIILIWSHKLTRISLLLIIFISLLLSIFFSIFSSIIIIKCYFCGCVVSFCLIKYRFEVGFFLQRLAHLYHGHLTPKKKFNKSCTICENLNCNRHQNALPKEPWKGLTISKELNQAIENFFNKILTNFITTWYENFTEDITFIDELRSSVRFATSNLLLRYLEIDVGNVIANKMVPCAIRHIDDCIQIKELSEKNNAKLDESAVSYLGRRLHAAVTNRENELEYLRQLTTSILPLILTKYNLNCKNFNVLIREIIAGWVFLPLMDVIADPNIINLLVNYAVTYKKKHTKVSHINTEPVELLYNFTNYKNVKIAALGCDLSKIFKERDIFYSFMQFIKDNGPVNILQFYLSIDEFNRKLLNPELSKLELDNLHSEATQIFQLYLKIDSPDFIECSHDLCSNFEHLLLAGPNNIPKFRTSTPLFKAYDFAFNILETEWLPLFFHSDEFYSLNCGQKIAEYQNYSGKRNKKESSTSQGPVSKFSSGINRLKGALKNQPIEGAVCQSEINEHQTETAQIIETNPPLSIEKNANRDIRDLSAWRISINKVEQLQGSKPFFHIHVKRIDFCLDSERDRVVYRYDQDFHTLKVKLIEFHGENEICDSPLPSRRSSTPLETKRQKYEEFLQKLLQKPSLRGSDLLYTFLTVKDNFTLLADTNVPIVSDLENIYQSVAHILRKEKGQRLESFMEKFLASTEIKELKLKYDKLDVGEEADSGSMIDKNPETKIRNLNNSIFENNFGISLPQDVGYNPSRFNPRDIIESSIYLLSNILNAPKGLLKLYKTICNFSSQAVDSLSRSLIERGLKSALSEHTLAHLIVLLQDAIFSGKSIPSTKYELEQRKIAAFNNFEKLNKGLICHWLGLEINDGLTAVLQILQHPQLNKQLAYSLLDILALEFFPDLNLNAVS